MKESCATCVFSRARSRRLNEAAQTDWVECRRFPPQFAWQGDTLNISSFAEFPSMDLDDWCGEHKNKDPKQ